MKIDVAQIEFLKEYLRKLWLEGNSPPIKVRHFQQQFFQHLRYEDVYRILRKAVIELRNDTKGEIQFRYDKWLGEWRYMVNTGDNMALIYWQQLDIGSRRKTQGDDFNFAKELYPKLKEEIKIIKAPTLHVSKLEVMKSQEENYEDTNN